MNETVSVSALNHYVKTLLENDEALNQLWIEGEISGFKLYPSSGHMYFTLKDDKSSVRAVMFRTYAQRVRFMPKDGMHIAAPCSVSLYERDGSFQVYLYDMLPKGEGAAQQQLDQLKDKLGREGLFSQDRKRPLPARPRCIAVITSSSGAVLHDIKTVLSRRDPFVTVRLYPVSVQGVYAVDSIVRALNMVRHDPDVDLVIVARGGGSREDLWVFNDESIVRAACALPVPFISAVGHEVDYTLIDYAADMRAATPSAAAELAVPEVMGMFTAACHNVASILEYINGRIAVSYRRLAGDREQLTEAALQMFGHQRTALETRAALLASLNPVAVLSRGFAIARGKDGHVIASVRDVEPGDRVSIALHDGVADAVVQQVREEKQDGKQQSDI